MFYSLYYAVYNMNNRICTPKYWNIFSSPYIVKNKNYNIKNHFFLDNVFFFLSIKKNVFFCSASLIATDPNTLQN